ncbi:MAG: hypothetical protein K2Q45_05375 [Nitrosomonas sp.]|nr:hypothetical protein [Nitrosomonas sp.]
MDKNSNKCLCKKCGTCSGTKLQTDFINKKGKLLKTCSTCLLYFKNRQIVQKKLFQSIIPQEGCQICTYCKLELKSENFKRENGQPTKLCISCRKTARRHEKLRLDKERNDNLEAFKEKRKKSSKRDRELIKNSDERRAKRNKLAKNYRVKFPEKTKVLNEKRQYYDTVLLSRYKTKSRKRELDWKISDQLAISLFNGTCAYCGQPDARGKCGIDRQDNSKGYVDDNCVSCCKICNIMKKQWSYESFVAYVGHIAAFSNLISQQYLVSHRLLECHGNDFSKYKKDAKAKERAFELSKDEFKNIVSKSCYLCGQKSSESHLNGIDRVDSKYGYIEGNVMTCCFHCNNLKHSHDLSFFKEHCKTVFLFSLNKVQFLNIPFQRETQIKIM